MATEKRKYSLTSGDGFYIGIIIFLISGLLFLIPVIYSASTDVVIGRLGIFVFAGLAFFFLWTYFRRVLFDEDQIYLKKYLSSKSEVIRYEDIVSIDNIGIRTSVGRAFYNFKYRAAEDLIKTYIILIPAHKFYTFEKMLKKRNIDPS